MPEDLLPAERDREVAEILAEIRQEILRRREEAGRDWLTRQDGLDLDTITQQADLVELPPTLDDRLLKGLAKRIVNRLIRFYVRRQSQFNMSAARLIKKLIEEGDARRQQEAPSTPPDLLRKIEQLQQLLAGYQARLDALHQRIAELEAELDRQRKRQDGSQP